jgi:hypothetical protein
VNISRELDFMDWKVIRSVRHIAGITRSSSAGRRFPALSSSLAPPEILKRSLAASGKFVPESKIRMKRW